LPKLIAYTVSAPKLQPACPGAGIAMYASSPGFAWYAGANARSAPDRDSSHSRPFAATTISPSRRGPTTSIGLARWMYGDHVASFAAGRAPGDVRATAPPQPTDTMPTTRNANSRLATNDKEYAP